MAYNILIIDDDSEVRSMVSDILEDEGYSVKQADGWDMALAIIKEKIPDLIFLDLWLDDDENAGIKILEKIKRLNSYIPVVMISGHGNIEVAVTAIKKGAYDFIEKPFVIERLLLTTNRAIESNELLKENIILKSGKLSFDVAFVGTSTFTSKLNSDILKTAQTNMRVIISGPNGCFPEAIAYSLHSKSSRARFPFIEIDCGFEDQEAVYERIFGGYGKKSALANAHGGTLFIREFLNLSKESQSELLKYTQTGCLNGLKIDARLIVYTSNRNYERDLSRLGFNKELFSRLNIHQIKVLPLKEHLADIESMINYYLENSLRIFGLPSKEISFEAKSLLKAYSWPGELVQLKNVLEFALISSKGKNVINVCDLPENILNESTSTTRPEVHISEFMTFPIKEAREAFEREYLKYQMWRLNGNISKIAEFIGMDRSALYKKFKTLQISINYDNGN